MPKLPSYRNQLIDCSTNQLTGFYMMASLAFNKLNPFHNDAPVLYSMLLWGMEMDHCQGMG